VSGAARILPAIGVAACAWLAVLCAVEPAAAQPGTTAARGTAPKVTAVSGRCGVCHPAERAAFEGSRHASEQVRCVSCHGGNDQALDVRVAHGGSFKGRIARRSVPSVCASCHADEEKMRPFNLPVDQYALYQTSGHGRRLARGDDRVAVCSDCHGAHGILPPSDPASSVFRTNIPQTCGRCHGDTTLVKKNVYAEYTGSVHGRELLDNGNPRAPTCVSCHGAHGAAPPELGDVGKVCGQCHTAERRYFMSGPHRQGLALAGAGECASCHGDHGVQRAPVVWLTQACAGCHDEKSAEVALGEKLYTEYHTAATDLDVAETLIQKAEAVPLATDDYRARLGQARTYASEALPAAHSIDEQTVTGFTNRARSVGAQIQSEIRAKLSNLRVRKLVLIVFWFYLILTVLVLRRFRDAAPSR
jgi:predicted CXXCH cytochrome family protein